MRENFIVLIHWNVYSKTATRKDGRPIDTQVQNIPRFQAVQRRVLEHKRSHKLTRVVFSVIAAFVLCMAPNQILNLVYLIQVKSSWV